MSNRPAPAAPMLAAQRQMAMQPIALAAILFGLATAPSFAQVLTAAEAVTYTGTVGGQAIVLELSEPKEGTLVGRYSYQSQGADIPLHPLSASKDDVVLAEEVPCTPALCVRPDGNLVLDPPLGGQFQLHYSADNTKLTGTWRASTSASAELAVDLTHFGQRDYDLDAPFPYASMLWMNYNGIPITPQTSPYDYAKMQVALTEGPLQVLNGATYREVSDPRTMFGFPRIVSLPGGGDVALVNAMLDQGHWAINFGGFECLGMAYRSGVWMPKPFGDADKPLGDIAHDDISIAYLSDTVMTIRQSRSIGCGAETPYNYVDYRTYDVRAGGAIDLSQIFTDWDATSNNPTQKLIDWVIAAYRKTPGYDADSALWCATSEYLTEGLDVSFAQGDIAVFLIEDIEDVSCMGAAVTVPLADIRDLLTDKAADYFPSLKS